MVKNLPAMQETWVQSLGQEDPLEKRTNTHSSVLAWEIPWYQEPGRLQVTVLQESDTTERLSLFPYRVKRLFLFAQEFWDILDFQVPSLTQVGTSVFTQYIRVPLYQGPVAEPLIGSAHCLLRLPQAINFLLLYQRRYSFKLQRGFLVLHASCDLYAHGFEFLSSPVFVLWDQKKKLESFSISKHCCSHIHKMRQLTDFPPAPLCPLSVTMLIMMMSPFARGYPSPTHPLCKKHIPCSSNV